MDKRSKIVKTLVLLAVAGILATSPAFAGKPSWVGKEKKVRADEAIPVKVDFGIHFSRRDRELAREYLSTQSARGHCPPGLAKKNNGCMPPGQARKWKVGKPLPDDIIVYELPSSLTVRLGTPPVGHRYVRAAADILLIAIGTGMVVDALDDLSEI
jgi:Ni/Co efflux regulator RcnB